MGEFEVGLWWLVSSVGVFLVLFPLSVLWGARRPRLFQALWLVFFLKLFVPLGWWSPVPDRVSVQALQTVAAPGDKVADPVAEIESAGSPISQGEPAIVVRSSEPLTTLAIALWVIGALLVGGFMVLAHRRARRRSWDGPITRGVFRPRVILPAGFEDQFTLLERDLIVAHERAHVRAGDPFWFAVAQVTACVFWWLPVVWWARSEFQAVTELACDRAVLLKRPPEQARVYGQLLLRLASSHVYEAGAAFAGTFGSLKRRVVAVMRPLGGRSLWLSAFLLVLAVGVGGLSLIPDQTSWVWPLPGGVEAPEVVVSAPGSEETLIGAARDTPVRAAADGMVTALVEDARHRWSTTLDHGSGIQIRYARLAVESTLQVGQSVKQGQPLGTVFGDHSVTDTDLPSLGLTVFQNGRATDPAGLFAHLSGLVRPVFLDQPLVWPLPDRRGALTTGFGMQIHPFTGQSYFHRGVDWARGAGTPVGSVAAGTVKTVQFEALGLGWYVDVDHGRGRVSRYGHLESVRAGLVPGTRLVAGETLGAVGATGLATGPHLHWQLSVDGVVLDPFAVTYHP